MTASTCATCHILSFHIFIPHSLAFALYFLLHFLCSPVHSPFSSILLYLFFQITPVTKKNTIAFPSPSSLSHVPSASLAQSV